MAATDVKPTRLEEAKQQVRDAINDMNSGDVAMIISFSDRAIVEQGYTFNRRILKRQLDTIRQTQRTSNLKHALTVASGLANPERIGNKDMNIDDQGVAEAQPATLLIYSDGRFPAVQDFNIGNLTPHYELIGEDDAENLGITVFSAQRNPEKPDQTQAFANIENQTDGDHKIRATLFHGETPKSISNTPFDAMDVVIKAGASGGVDFALDNLEQGVLKLTIETIGSKVKDALKLDDVAYAAINSPQRARILCIREDNDPLDLVLDTTGMKKAADVTFEKPEYLGSKKYLEHAGAGSFDLIIYDLCSPKKLPQANTLFIGSVPPGTKKYPENDALLKKVQGEWLRRPKQFLPVVIDTDRNHPLMQFVEMGDVTIAEATPVEPPPGGAVLIDSDIGTLYSIAPRGGYEDAVLGLPIIGYDEESKAFFPNTNWPFRKSFALLTMNIVSYLGGGSELQQSETVKPGATKEIHTEIPVKEITVRTPDGRTDRVARAGENVFNYTSTEQIGIYQVSEGKDGPESLFAVNLFDSQESNIRPSTSLPIGQEIISARSGWQPMRTEAWKYLLLFGVVVLLVEWYIYNRRVYI